MKWHFVMLEFLKLQTWHITNTFYSVSFVCKRFLLFCCYLRDDSAICDFWSHEPPKLIFFSTYMRLGCDGLHSVTQQPYHCQRKINLSLPLVSLLSPHQRSQLHSSKITIYTFTSNDGRFLLICFLWLFCFACSEMRDPSLNSHQSHSYTYCD